MTLSEELQWRGFVNQTTLTDIKQLDGDPISFYWGVDPSADSMHIGQLSMAIMIKHFIAHGHKATILIGGATGMIGDPDGRGDERDLKSIEEIDGNKRGIVAQYETLFGTDDIDVVDNYDWFKNINYLDFLRDIGKHFSMTQLLDRDFVQSRIGKDGAGISYAEFSYSLIQGYDFLYLYREKGITLQIAGADQWGNSISGVEMIRKLEKHSADVWTAPLVINKSTGRKFGKSEAGAVWLDPAKTTAYQFYQFWLNVDDDGVIDYAKLYTFMTKEQIEQLTADNASNPGARVAQRRLASEVTAIVHGPDRTSSVIKVSEVLFGKTPFVDLGGEDLDVLSKEVPTLPLGGSISLVDALTQSGVVASKGEARRLLLGGAISINGDKVADDQQLTNPALIKKGKNTFLLIR